MGKRGIPQLRYIYRDCGIYSVFLFFGLNGKISPGNIKTHASRNINKKIQQEHTIYTDRKTIEHHINYKECTLAMQEWNRPGPLSEYYLNMSEYIHINLVLHAKTNINIALKRVRLSLKWVSSREVQENVFCLSFTVIVKYAYSDVLINIAYLHIDHLQEEI